MYKQYINGELVEGKGRILNVYDPATEELIAAFPGADKAQTEEALLAAQEAFKTYRHSAIQERIDLLPKLRDAVIAEKEEIMDLISAESGRPYAQAFIDYNWFIRSCTYFAEEASRMVGTSFPQVASPYGSVYHITEFRPLGVIVGHLAWNYPLGNLGVKLCPAIVAGCTGIYKPSSQTPLATLHIGELCHKLGFPKGVVNILSGAASEVATTLNKSTIPRMLSLIGSSETGLRVMQEGSTSIKRYVLECGGNAPVVIMDDVDIPAVAKAIVAKKCGYTGQTCVNYNRIYIEENIYDKMIAAIQEELKNVTIGCHRDPGAFVMGPLIDKAARDYQFELIKDAVASGATLVCGGEIPEGFDKGWYITPALVKDVTDDMRMSKEEIFGPIIPVQSFTDFDKVLEQANNTEYGLSAYFYGHDAREISKAVEAFEAGEIFVNGAPGTDQTPHPGTKHSGVGCDKSQWSLQQFFDFKVVSMVP